MPPYSTFSLYDRIVGGQLEAMLRGWRSEGVTLADIVFRLRTEHEVVTTTTTVHRWCESLGIEKPDPTPPASLAETKA